MNNFNKDRDQIRNYMYRIPRIWEENEAKDIPNIDLFIYLEAIYKMVWEKIEAEDRKITVDQVKFLVETLEEALQYRIPELIYPDDPDHEDENKRGYSGYDG